jgi:hypothetical protein
VYLWLGFRGLKGLGSADSSRKFTRGRKSQTKADSKEAS